MPIPLIDHPSSEMGLGHRDGHPTMRRRARSPRIPKPGMGSVGLSKRHPKRSLRSGNATICSSQSPCSLKTLDCGRLKGSLGGVCDATMTLAASIKLALRWPLFLLSMALLYWSVVVGSLGGYIKFLDLKSEQRGDLFAWCVLGLGGWPEVGVPRVPCRPRLTSVPTYNPPILSGLWPSNGPLESGSSGSANGMCTAESACTW